MILLLDQGNSRVKWALTTAAGEFVAVGAEVGAVPGPASQAVLMRAVVNPDALRVGIGSVASTAHRQLLLDWLSRWGSTEAHAFSVPAQSSGLTNGYNDPARLGVDRWLAMVGARAAHAGAALVVDAGTALTIDAIDAGGRHLGGYIVPGMQLQLGALAGGAAQIEPIPAGTGIGWGKNTAQAVASGVLLSLVAFVERAAIELSNRLDDTCRVIVTGGDASALAAHLQWRDLVIDPELVFRGMLVELPPIT